MRSVLEVLSRGLETDPDAIAVHSSQVSLRWKDLDRSSDHVGAWLVQQGLEAGDRVALLMDRSVDAVVAIFGTWKAGGVYVPLDPLSPPERNRALIMDSGARRLLTREKWMRRVAPLESVLDERAVGEIGTLVSQTQEVPSPSLRPQDEDLAALLYTSGSTGRPKGVMLSHRAILAFVDWAVERFELDPSDRVSGVSPLHFDLSTFEIFGALAAGARVCIAPTAASAFPESLAAFMAEERISCWYSVPSVLMRLASADLSEHDLSALRQVAFAGEVFPSAPLAELMGRLPWTRFHNLFGPTESNVCVAARIQTAPGDADPIPIGTAASGARLQICDEHGAGVGAGERGELWVAGPSLMSGYWSDPEGTGRVLVEASGELWLRTGDEVHEQDGQLWYHGRLDSMLKVDGYRLHPEEIERVLCSQPGVRAAVVRKVEGRLHAWVEGADVEPEALIRACSRSLPAYMRPAVVEVVDRLDRGARGKLRR